jgi:2-methylisocitrate lyase-like PEP mutase family enzyme
VEAPRSVAEIRHVAEALRDVPLLINLIEGGLTPLLPAAELEALGYRIALYANTALRAAARGVQHVLTHLHHTGSSLGAEALLLSWDERQRLVRLPEIDALARRYGEPLS